LAGAANTTGWQNTFLGEHAGGNHTTGFRNTFLGNYAGSLNTTGTGNVFIGREAGFNEIGSNKLYIANSSADPPLIYGDFSTGNVGIGTTSPLAGIHVSDPAWANLKLTDQTDSHTAEILTDGNLHIDGGGQNVWIDPKGVGNLLLMCNSNGNVGIGTTNPSTKLEVTGSSSEPIILGNNTGTGYGLGGICDNGNGIRGQSANGYGVVGSSTSNTGVYGHSDSGVGGYFTSISGHGLIVENGNVGIGTTEPAGKLDIDVGPEGPVDALIINKVHTSDGNPNAIIALCEYTGNYDHGAIIGEASGVKASGYKTGVLGSSIEAGSRNIGVLGRAWGATENFAGYFSGTTYISGNLGIGTESPAYDLDVNGDIRAIGSVFYGGTEGNANGTAYLKPDYVFEEGYGVMSIDQVETYLKKENHLPWMTSTKQEKEENGNVIDMTRMAFETVETAENIQIQVIELNKLIKDQAELIKTQQKRITALEDTFAQNEMLKQRLDALEKMIRKNQLAKAM
jgi:hypothetical protein